MPHECRMMMSSCSSELLISFKVALIFVVDMCGVASLRRSDDCQSEVASFAHAFWSIAIVFVSRDALRGVTVLADDELYLHSTCGMDIAVPVYCL